MSTRRLLIAPLSVALIAAFAGQVAIAKSPKMITPIGGVSAARSSNDIRLFASAGTTAYYANGKFKAVYRERISTSTVTQIFKFEVEAFPAGVEVPVSLNGIFITNVIVNSLGGGEFQFRNIDNNPGGELPLPTGFPRLRAGDTITIGPLTATFN